MTSPATPPGIWVGQLGHFVCLTVLLALAYAAWQLLGEPFAAAFWIAIAFPVLHQVYVWLAWRLELRSSATSATIGFRGYLVAFYLLFVGRFLAILALAWLDRGSLGLPWMAQEVAATLLALPALFTLYSVRRYFGLVRAAGADHFDPSYREMPLVREGIFRFTSNGMYYFAFLGIWAIAVAFGSAAGLVVAAFSHAYIWVHFFGTEKPDMRFLYGVR